MQEEGWTNISQIPPITLSYATGTAYFDQEVQALVQQWQQVLHITVTVDLETGDALLDKATNATDNLDGIQMWGLSWGWRIPRSPGLALATVWQWIGL